MLKMDLYIHSLAAVSPEAAPVLPVNRLLMQEPDYTGIIPPMQLRRMSKAVRTGIWASQQCLSGAGIDRPDAIITGTGFGCLQDTEVFLKKIIEQDEHLLTPTAFIQSTHNTVAGQIALLKGCTGYNLTLSQGGHSFENALLAAQLYLAENPGHTVLAGGVDELTDTSLYLQQRLGVYVQEAIAPARLLEGSRPGTLAGEGAAFFTLSGNPAGASMRITGLQLFVAGEAEEQLPGLIQAIGGGPDFILGESGDAASQPSYDALRTAFPQARYHTFKAHCGDYPTAVSYGLARAVDNGATETVLINHWCDCWSVIRLETV